VQGIFAQITPGAYKTFRKGRIKQMIQIKKGRFDRIALQKGCGERLTILQGRVAYKGCGERLTILQGCVAYKGCGERLTILQGPAEKNGLPEMPLLTPECIIFLLFIFEDSRQKRCTHTRETFFLEIY
jgi:hypothetical protein